jgi:hypothetical protein
MKVIFLEELTRMLTLVFWVVMPGGLVGMSTYHFKGTYRLHLQD